MATDENHAYIRQATIAPAPDGGLSRIIGNGDDKPGQPSASETGMPYTCQPCAKRKVKCDKATPICFSCRKSKLSCFYQAPIPRLRKTRLSNHVWERLARYEKILHEHGLLDADPVPSVGTNASNEPASPRWGWDETSQPGKLLAGPGKSRYLDSSLWRTLGEDGLQHISDNDGEDDDEEYQVIGNGATEFFSDPLTATFMGGSQKPLLLHHPTCAKAMTLWHVHVENVEPVCKILHIPSTTKIVEEASKQPAKVSKANECLLFAVYHFAVFSMTEEDCCAKLGESRATLLERYHYATRQALVNALFLKTTEMAVLQALTLFLISSRSSYDSHTYWILTGVAVRIAQRMGIHRDGEKLGLPPFDVQMRRRLFYQLLPLDGKASLVSGPGMMALPDTWDTRPPLNINDDQIWPGMTYVPQEQKGATDMIFCLSRACVGAFLVKTRRPMNGTDSAQMYDNQEAERDIDEAEKQVEEKYIRYCDILNPLHILTMGLARSGILAMRLRLGIPKVRNQTATDAERRGLFQLARRILETDTASYAHPGLRKYRWHVGPFFLWGTWDSFIFILTSLWRKSDLLSPAETITAWTMLEQVYQNHEELLEMRCALHVALGRLALKAWEARLGVGLVPEPGFIRTLEGTSTTSNRTRGCGGRSNTRDAEMTMVQPPGQPLASLSEGMAIDTSVDFNLYAEDWLFWDQLIQDYQTQGEQAGGLTQRSNV